MFDWCQHDAKKNSGPLVVPILDARVSLPVHIADGEQKTQDLTLAGQESVSAAHAVE
jgi:hypothetical protein